jgi:hypothetical protein
MIPPCMMQIKAPKFALSEENLRPRQIPAHRANHWVLTQTSGRSGGELGRPGLHEFTGTHVMAVPSDG